MGTFLLIHQKQSYNCGKRPIIFQLLSLLFILLARDHFGIEHIRKFFGLCRSWALKWLLLWSCLPSHLWDLEQAYCVQICALCYLVPDPFHLPHCRILPEILPLLKFCERSELVNISQLFHSFSQTRLLIVELSQAKPELDWKTSKMTRQFCREKWGKNGHILDKNPTLCIGTKNWQKYVNEWGLNWSLNVSCQSVICCHETQ